MCMRSKWLGIIPLAFTMALSLGLHPASGHSFQLEGSPNTQHVIAQPPPLSIEAADRLITQVFSTLNIQQYERAVEAYFAILQRLKDPLSEKEINIATRHMYALSSIMNERTRRELGVGNQNEGTTLLEGLPPEISTQLIRWWRLQDVIPATELNDRLVEHLHRTVTAWTVFALPQDPRGFDDRGEIYVRLGEPSTKTVIRLLSTDLQQNGIGLRVPPNEFWVYHHIAYDAHYIFTRLQKKTGYALSTPLDLIPKRIQNSRQHTQTMLAWMEEVYGQLALQHTIYGSLYDEVTNYLTLPGNGADQTDIFARSMVHNAGKEDQQLTWQRTQNVPSMFSNTFGSAESLDLPYRWTRFLEPDGRTRIEVDWSLEAHALKPTRRFVRQMYKEGHVPSENYLVSLYSSVRDIDLTRAEGIEKHYLTDAGALDTLPVKTLHIPTRTDFFNLVLHWEQRWTLQEQKGQSPLLPGALVKYHSLVVDSIQALHSEGTSLEISDIKVLQGTLPEEALPYPHQSLTNTTQIALYFEVYNLAFGPDDRTAYTISYEINLLGKKENGTSVSTSHIGDSRRTEEFIIPDLSKEDVTKGVEIVLTITDDLTGEERRRSVQFESH